MASRAEQVPAELSSEPSLPAELITRILQHASEQDRLTAMLVDTSWKAAALAATTEVSVTDCSSEQLGDLANWLAVHESGLNHLTSLQLEFKDDCMHVIPHLPCRHLRELKLSVCAGPSKKLLPPATLQACTGSLTRLVLKGFNPSDFTSQSLGQLTALQELDLVCCSQLDAGALLDLPSLKSLYLYSDLVAALPALLAKQHQLTRLMLGVNSSRRDQEDEDEDEERHSLELQLAAQLTVSTKLQHLDLGGVLSHLSWQHMFPEGRVLPQLRYFDMPVVMDGMSRHELDSAQVLALARCCPALHTLLGARCLLVQPPLSSLCHLTSLDASVPKDVTEVQVLTALTALERLHIRNVAWGAATVNAVLLPLLPCSRLTSLTVSAGCFNNGFLRDPDSVITTLAQLTRLVELDVSRVIFREEELLSLTPPMVRLSYLAFSTHGVWGAFSTKACSTFNTPSGSTRVEVKATPGGPTISQQLLTCVVPKEQEDRDALWRQNTIWSYPSSGSRRPLPGASQITPAPSDVWEKTLPYAIDPDEVNSYP